jgi:DNA mismatch repair ATPase MutS
VLLDRALATRRYSDLGGVSRLICPTRCGLITTHDLAIAEAIAPLGEAVGNCHFTDHLEDGRLVFDYQLRSGSVTGSIALPLMRSIGLDM